MSALAGSSPRKRYGSGPLARIRPATGSPSDRRALEEALLLAARWREPEPGQVPREVLAYPDLSRYIVEWPRYGDFGLIAEEDNVAIGAAWYRIFTPDSPGYGFVDSSIPELTIAIRHRHRGRGIGSRLLRRLIDHAGADGVAALSLSVEEDNPALSLYCRLGFEIVGRNDNAWTMRLDLA